jgi:RNA polymerase sigma-70 factor (ECF subfamily)
MDSSLLEQLQHEETRLQAFETLVKAHYAQVKGWIRRWIDDPTVAEDITQETFLRAWTNCHSFRGESAFSSWLYTIARRETLRYLDQQRRLRVLPWPQPTEEGIIWEPAAEPTLDYERLYREMQAVVEELPPMQRAVYQAAWEEHRPYREVATRLGIRENTVKAHLYHIRQRLWRRLRSWLGEE